MLCFPATLYCRIKIPLSAQQLSYCFWRTDIILTPQHLGKYCTIWFYSVHIFINTITVTCSHHSILERSPTAIFSLFCNIKIWRRWMKVSCMFLSVGFYSSHEQWWTWQPGDWNPLFNHSLGAVQQKDIFLYTAPVARLSPELESLSYVSEKKHRATQSLAFSLQLLKRSIRAIEVCDRCWCLAWSGLRNLFHSFGNFFL